MEVSVNGAPKWMVYVMGNPMKIRMMTGGSPFFFGNLHIKRPKNLGISPISIVVCGLCNSPGNGPQNIQNSFRKKKRNFKTKSQRWTSMEMQQGWWSQQRRELDWRNRNGDRTRGKTKRCVESSTPGKTNIFHTWKSKQNDSTDAYESAQCKTRELLAWSASILQLSCISNIVYNLHLSGMNWSDFLRLTASYPSVITQVSSHKQLHQIKKNGKIHQHDGFNDHGSQTKRDEVATGTSDEKCGFSQQSWGLANWIVGFATQN